MPAELDEGGRLRRRHSARARGAARLSRLPVPRRAGSGSRYTPGKAYPVSDLELASRLSFFLWSSIPDDQLLDLAERGRLKNPVVLQQQVQRMLADPRSEALVSNFAGQWLHLRNVETATPDPVIFPFDEALRDVVHEGNRAVRRAASCAKTAACSIC